MKTHTPLVLLALLLGCPNNDPPPVEADADTDADTDTDTDADTDTDLPPGPDDTVAVADFDAADQTGLCAELGAIGPVSLTCGDADLLYAPDPFDALLCEADLADVAPACDVTAGDLRDCADDIAAATCTSDFAVDPCRSLYQPTCAPLDALATRLLGAPFGLQDALPIGGLSADQQFALCLQFDAQPTVVTCDGEDITIVVPPPQECAAQLSLIPAACDATIGETFACSDAQLAGDCDALFGGGPCAVLSTPACAPPQP
jgi:hypothetical protein